MKELKRDNVFSNQFSAKIAARVKKISSISGSMGPVSDRSKNKKSKYLI
jgi:hypothetical protein